MFVDDGLASKWFHVDNQTSASASASRLGGIGAGLRAGCRIEPEIQSNRSNGSTSCPPTNGLDAQGFTERWIDAWVEGGWGRVNLGQGSGAADGALDDRPLRHQHRERRDVADIGGGFLRTATGRIHRSHARAIDQPATSRAATTAYVHDAGIRRLPGQVGCGQKDNNGEATEFSVWYSGKLAGDSARSPAAFGWSTARQRTGGTKRRVHRRLGVLAACLRLQPHRRSSPSRETGSRRRHRRDADHTFFKVGYKFGTHAISVDYGIGDDQAAAATRRRCTASATCGTRSAGWSSTPRTRSSRWTAPARQPGRHHLARSARASGSKAVIRQGFLAVFLAAGLAGCGATPDGSTQREGSAASAGTRRVRQRDDVGMAQEGHDPA